MITIGLDQSLNVTGGAIYDDEILKDGGTFKTKATDDIAARLNVIYDKLSELYENYHFSYIFLEDCQQQSNRNVQTFHKLSMVKAAVLLGCAQNEMEYTVLAPSHWRSILKSQYGLVGFGRSRAEQKKSARGFVKDHYNIDVSEDEADAICIGAAGIIEKNFKKSAF